MFEILKLKLHIPSKFEKDKRLQRQIIRDSETATQTIRDKINHIQRRISNVSFKAASSTHVRFDNASGKKQILIELSDNEDNVDDNDDSDDIAEIEKTNRNFQDVIDMINENEFEYLMDANSESNRSDNSDTDDKDSKCVQFGKYAKKKETIKLKKSKSTLESNLSPRLRSKNKSQQKSESEDGAPYSPVAGRSNSAGLGDALESLELKYKSIRNERNKLLRKKKGLEINVQRQQMSDELKVIRREMKKMRQRKRKSYNKNFQDDSNDFIPLITNANTNNSTIGVKNRNSKKKNFKKQLNFRKKSNKPKTNRTS